MPDRLATLRANCALNLAVCDLPKHARIGLDNHLWNRVIVEPDGTITLAEDDTLRWTGRPKPLPRTTTKPPRRSTK
jgi:hypothetical protein